MFAAGVHCILAVGEDGESWAWRGLNWGVEEIESFISNELVGESLSSGGGCSVRFWEVGGQVIDDVDRKGKGRDLCGDVCDQDTSLGSMG